MKKKLYFLFAILSCLLFANSCSYNSNSEISQTSISCQKNTFSPNYQIFRNDHDIYEYVIYDIDNNILDRATWDYGEPQITNLNTVIFKVLLPDGTNSAKCIYYDIISKKKSPIYEKPYDESENGLVAFFVSLENDIYNVKLRICDIFDPDVFSVDISRNFISEIYPADCVKFLYNHKIYVAYQVFETGDINEMIQGKNYSFKTIEEIIEY